MATLRIKVKQHTPLIHFQADQQDAFLRGSELKPTLDRFLIHSFKENSLDYKKYLLPSPQKQNDLQNLENKEALNYKVRIQNLKKNDASTIPDRYPLFFGNLGREIEKYNFVFTSLPFDIEFFSFDEELLDKIRKLFPCFLMNTNFGNRKSKGFGSFFIHNSHEYTLDDKVDKYSEEEVASIQKLDYCFTLTTNRAPQINHQAKWRWLFSSIEKFYDSLRKGLERNTIEPFIKRYAESMGLNWEKDGIKEKFINNNTPSTNNTFIFKDLFGLSSLEDWGGTKINKEHIQGESPEKIERYASPLFFKPIETSDGYDVNIKIGKVHPLFFEQTFSIQKVVDPENKLNLKTPSQFDYQSFFDYILNQYEKIRELPNEVRQIYDSLKKNKNSDSQGGV